MGRPGSDIGRLDTTGIMVKEEGLSIFFREPKEGQMKAAHVGYLPEEHRELCPVTTTLVFLKRTEGLRLQDNGSKSLFWAYLDHEKYFLPPIRLARRLIGSWLKEILKEVNIDIRIFKAHSFRSAAATEAVMACTSILEVKKQANWSLTSDTFKKCYFLETAK